MTPCAGTLGGKEVAVEAKEQTIRTLTAQKAAAQSDKEKASLQAQIDETTAILADIQAEAYALMLTCINLALTIGTTTAEIEVFQSDLLDAEAAFSQAMGDMLQDGYYSDETYGPGQEQALYNDSVEMLKILSAPQNTYELREKDIANVPGYDDEIYTMNMAVHFYDELLEINDYGFVSAARQAASLPGDISRGRRSSMSQPKTRPDSPVPSLQGPWRRRRPEVRRPAVVQGGARVQVLAPRAALHVGALRRRRRRLLGAAGHAHGAARPRRAGLHGGGGRGGGGGGGVGQRGDPLVRVAQHMATVAGGHGPLHEVALHHLDGGRVPSVGARGHGRAARLHAAPAAPSPAAPAPCPAAPAPAGPRRVRVDDGAGR